MFAVPPSGGRPAESVIVGVPPLGGSDSPAEAGTPTRCRSHFAETKGPRLLVLLTLIGLLLPTLPVAAQAPPAPKWSSLEEALGKEDYAAAKKLADAIVQRGASDDRAKAAAVYGRILLGLGQTDGARQHLAMQAKQGFAAQQGAIYAAWLTAQCGKPDEAAQALEAILRQAGDSPDEAVAEAADVLAMLYMARDDMEKAKQIVDFGLKVLQYRGVKDGYLLALLRNRLASNFTAGAAKRLYDQAEKLRKEAKFQPAGQAYMQVFSLYPGDEYGHASGFRVGQCLEALGRRTQAEQHWTGFVSSSSAGPWRGQARIALVHLLLARGDLKAASQHAAAAHQILSVGVDEPAVVSWNNAATEIHLCQGIVALLENRHDATAALREANSSASVQEDDPRFLAGLDRLIDVADRQADLIPNELAAPDEKFRLALSLGVIYNVLGRFEQACDAFDYVLRAPMRLALQPHRSFAALGKARALVGLTVADRVPSASLTAPSSDSADNLPLLTAAKAAYLVSLDATPDAAWNEHTLRELALLIEELAARQAETFRAARAEAKSDPKAKPREVASADTRAMLRAARAEALPYWEKLIARFPASTYLPEALYHAGILYAEAVKPAAEKSVASFERLVNEFPASPWTGDAHVRLIDVKLEQQFDLPAATTHAIAATQWLANAGGANAAAAFASNEATPAPTPLPSASVAAAWSACPAEADGTTERAYNSDDRITPPLPSLREIRYAIYLRAGLMAYLSEHLEEAVEWFEKAKPFEPERGFVVVHGEIPTGIERLVEAAKSGKSLTPEEARRGDEKARLILMLADVYMEAQQWSKAIELCDILLDTPRSSASRDQQSWAYHQKGAANSGISHYLDARRCHVLAQRVSPSAPWAPRSLFLAASIADNLQQDPANVIREYKAVMLTYPDTDAARTAAYLIGVSYEWDEQWSAAKRVYEWFIKRYPESPTARTIRTSRLPNVEKQLHATTQPSKGNSQ